MRERAKLLMSEDCTWSPTRGNLPSREGTTFAIEFEKFCDSLGSDGEAWKDCSRLFFEPDAISQYMVIRRQVSDTCCLHAAVVYQHYLQCHFSKTYDHTMLDVASFLRNHVDKGKQKAFIEGIDINQVWTGTVDSLCEQYELILMSQQGDL